MVVEDRERGKMGGRKREGSIVTERQKVREIERVRVMSLCLCVLMCVVRGYSQRLDYLAV
jgi:hypothetical protein